MAKANKTSFDLDLEEASKPVEKPLPKEKKDFPKKKIKKEQTARKKDPEKEIQKNIVPIPVEQNKLQEPLPVLEVLPVKKAEVKIPTVSHEAIVIQIPKDNQEILGIHADPVIVTVVGTAAAVAAGTAAVSTGVATPAITAVKAGIIKAKAALGISSKSAAVVATTAAAGAALVTLEKKFTNYENEIHSAKQEVEGIGDQIKKLDQLLDNIKK